MELEKRAANGTGTADVAAGGGGAIPGSAASAHMAEELSAARSRCAALEADVAKWEVALAGRDVELQNLQRALGEAARGGGVGGGVGDRQAARGWGVGDCQAANGGGQGAGRR